MSPSSNAVAAKSVSYRREFRQVLQKVVETLHNELRVPGVSEFNANDLAHWFQEITLEDIQAVWNEEIATDKQQSTVTRH
jgi:hypothetical protein